MNRCLLAVVIALSFFFGNAAVVDGFDGPTYYVDSRVSASGSGSQSSPFKTLQEALNATSADGCKIILAEGVYDVGVMEYALGDHSTFARGVVSHKTNIVGAGRDKTFVVGAKATAPDVDGNGAGAVRCLLFAAEAEGSLVEGLTLQGGRTDSADASKTSAATSVRIFSPNGEGSFSRISDGGVNAVAKGGGAFAVRETSGGLPVLLVDVTIDDCRAGYCGGAVYGNFGLIRCLVKYCRGGLLQSGAVAGLRGAYCSIFTHNGGTSSGEFGERDSVVANARAMNATTYFVNCTMASNRGAGISKLDPSGAANGTAGWEFYNCGFFDGSINFTCNQALVQWNCAMNNNGLLPNGQDNIGGDWGNNWVGKQYWLAEVKNDTGVQTWNPQVKCDAYGWDQLVSIHYDFRPKANAFILDKGNVKWLSGEYCKIGWVPEELRGKDFKGDVRTDGEHVAIGAYQNGVALGSPYVIENFSETKINGYTYETPNKKSLDEGLYGEPYSYVTVESRNGEEVFGFTTKNVVMNGHASSYKNLYPLGYRMGTEFLIPPAGGSKITYTYVKAASVKWVDPKDGKDEDGRGSEDAPYKTLQYSADNSTAKGVVYLKAGEYKEGEGSAVGDFDWIVTTKARLTIKKSLRICGVEGAEKTFVCGRESTDSGFVNTGCGSGALRCIAFATSDADGAVQGVTLTGGRTDSDPVGKLKAAGKKAYNIDCFNWSGGAFIGWSWTSSSQIHIQFFDCIISNCVAYRASAACNGAFHRCVFTRNHCVDFSKETNKVDNVNGMLQNCIADSCLFVDNPEEPYGILHSGSAGGSSRIVNCTVKGDNVPACTLYRLKAPQVYNTIVDNFANLGDVGTGGGNVVWPDAKSWTTDNRLVADPMIANTAVYKCRTVNGSPAENYGSYGAWIFENSAYRGLDGERMTFDANGKVNSGCYQKLVRGCTVSANLGKTTDMDGTYAFEDSERPQEIEIKAKKLDRPFEGFAVNGVLVPGTSDTYTWSSEADPPVCSVVACYKVNADFYVNAGAQDDSADGFSPETPKRTLNAALALALRGDTVHLSEGVYSENAKVHERCLVSEQGSRHVIPAVGVVPAGVTLVADGAQDKTVIKGRWGTAESTQNMSFGEDAVRCLVAYEDTKVKGVTLYNGGVMKGKYGDGVDSTAEDQRGAGVLGTDTTVYEDCFFSNLVARYSAAFANEGTAIRCKFIRCGASSANGVCAAGKLYSCYVNRCFDSPIGSARVIKNCTIGPDNRIAFDWGYCGTTIQMAAGGILENTLLLTPASSSAAMDNNLQNVRNCMFHISHTNRFNGTTWGEGCEFLALAAFKLGEENRPTKDSPVVDAGYNGSLGSEESSVADLDGKQRVYNGTVDIGCYEYDWRPQYAEDLGHRAITEVNEASPAVRENANGKVELADGTKLVFSWPGKGSPRRAEFEIVGGGELTVTETGKDSVTYTADSLNKFYEVEHSDANTRLTFAFSGEGSATIGRCHGSGGLSLIVRLYVLTPHGGLLEQLAVRR